jgi:sugar phosphate isomerase/epimerase
MTDPLKSVKIGTLIRGANATTAIRELIPYGFESFSLQDAGSVIASDPERSAGEIMESLGDSGVSIGALGISSAFGNPLETSEADIAVAKDWENAIDCAHLFGTDIVSGFTGRLRGKPIDQSYGRFAEVFGPLAKRAQDKGVRLAFENCDMGGTWATGDYNIAHNPTAWEAMFNAVPLDNIGLEWEPCHQMVSLIDPMPQLRKYVNRIFHVHGKDATVYWDVVREHGIHGPHEFAFHRTPGFGDSNWTDIISDLRRGGFVGSIDIEGWHDPIYRGDLEQTAQIRSLKYLKDCRGGADYVPNGDGLALPM